MAWWSKGVAIACATVAVVGGATSLDAAAASGWTMVPAPVSSGTSDQVFAVACQGTKVCWAVGQYVDAGGVQRVVIESSTGGSWTRATAGGAAAQGQLFGVSCDRRVCWAVGSTASDQQTLIERNGGGGWSVVPSPTPAAASGGRVRLQSVACLSAALCWAVGWYLAPGATPQTLIEQYDGAAWSIVAGPPVGAGGRLFGIACTTSSCYAAGHSFDATGNHTLIESESGGVWSAVAVPSPGDTDNVLFGISCVATGPCWAVGRYDTSGLPNQTLILEGTGSSWTTQSSANVTAASDELAGVACPSASHCVAVGDSVATAAGSRQQTLVEEFNGSAWAVSSSASRTDADNLLLGVACAGSSKCWAGGYAQDATSLQPLLEANFRVSGK